MSETKCPVCNSPVNAKSDYDRDKIFYVCPVCGRYELTISGFRIQNNPHLGSYLLYHKFQNENLEYRYHTTMSKEKCDAYRTQFELGDLSNGHPVHLDHDIVENWYPKTFAERIDNILLYLNSITKHIGQSVELNHIELCSILFVDQKEIEKTGENACWRKEEECFEEVSYMLEYLMSKGYIMCDPPPEVQDDLYYLTLSPDGYSRVDAIQKNTSYGKNAFVAMKFGNDTIPLREAIREGITKAGYIAVLIDEVPHNEFITPELLKYIRDSKFVVVDLTHQNNGAYFEEGYAMGLGKPVIQLCQKDTQLHFDIAQKNTIMWETEADIPERLENRIKATID